MSRRNNNGGEDSDRTIAIPGGEEEKQKQKPNNGGGNGNNNSNNSNNGGGGGNNKSASPTPAKLNLKKAEKSFTVKDFSDKKFSGYGFIHCRTGVTFIVTQRGFLSLDNWAIVLLPSTDMVIPVEVTISTK